MEERERLSRERYKIKFGNVKFENRQVYDSGKEDRGKTFHILQVLGTNEDFWDIVSGLGSES